MCTQSLIALAREAGERVHVQHITSEEEAVFLTDRKDIATAEATLAHLTPAVRGCCERPSTLAQLNPPIRERAVAPAAGTALTRASSTRSAPITRRIRARKGRTVTRKRIPA